MSDKKTRELILSSKQAEKLNAAKSNINALQKDKHIIEKMLNDAANGADSIIEIICEANNVEYLEGIEFDGEKLIIPTK